MNTVHGEPDHAAASATPWAWLPADAATTARPPSWESTLVAPLILNDPVRWRHSALSHTSRPVRRDSEWE